MSKQRRSRTASFQRATWRDYQTGLQRRGERYFTRRRLGKIVAVVALFICGLYGAMGLLHSSACQEKPRPTRNTANQALPQDTIAKRDVRILLEQTPLINLQQKRLRIAFGESHFIVETSLDMALQKHLTGQLDRANSRYIGIVAMDPADGRILAMAGYDKTNPHGNPCLSNRFPAASIFKIVTAAAAAEKKGYGPHTRIHFNGYKHTLYKNQLKDQKNRYTNSIAFKDSFAQSVNPVFGKIGSLHLGKEGLLEYARAFGFNRTFGFEKPLPPSRFEISDEPYHWAELASGFNRQTTLSPVHGAMLAAVFLNRGKLVEPTIIAWIDDPSGKRLYRSRPKQLGPVIGPEALKTVDKLMATTISAGTGRKAFRGHRRDGVLAQLHLGGKTGSIYNRSHDERYDWFVGFARPKKGSTGLAVAVVVAHEEFIGRRATEYARSLFKAYYQKHLVKTGSQPALHNGKS